MSISFVSPLSPVILGNLVPLSSHSFCVFFLIRHLMATDHRAGFGVVFERENPPTPALRNVLQSSWRRTKKVAWFLHGFPTMSTIVAHCSMWHYAIQHFLETTMPKLLSMMLKATICLGADIYYPIYFLPFLGHGSKWACKPNSGNSSKVTRVILLLLLETVRSKNQNQKRRAFVARSILFVIKITISEHRPAYTCMIQALPPHWFTIKHVWQYRDYTKKRKRALIPWLIKCGYSRISEFHDDQTCATENCSVKHMNLATTTQATAPY